MTTSNAPIKTIVAVSVLSTVALVLLCLLIFSYKSGKIIKGKYRPGDPPFADRKQDPGNYWLVFIQLSLLCAFLIGVAIWIFIHGA
jgi:hypothetical protein